MNIFAYSTERRKRFIKLCLVLVALGFGIWVFFWIYGHSIISVTVNNPGKQKMFFTITNQATKKVEAIEANTSNLRRTVPKGDYEVTVSYQETSYFAVGKTKPFLAKTKIDAQLLPEKARSFIGNEPDSCMYYYDQLLVSGNCGGYYSDFMAHLPATASSPTTTINTDFEFVNFSVGGIIKLGDKRFALIEGSRNLHDPTKEHVLVDFNNELKPKAVSKLSGLGQSTSHRIAKYRSGFLIYSTDFKELTYYSSPSASPESIVVEPPAEDLLPASIDVNGQKIVILYSEGSAPEEHKHVSDEEDVSQKSQKVAIVYEAGKVRSVPLEDGVDGASSVRICGANYLCYKNEQELSVVDITNEPINLFEITGVLSVHLNGAYVVVERISDILGIDPSSRAGSIWYSFGSYSACGVQPSETGYAVCIRNPEESVSALHLNPEKANDDNIDKKVLAISEQPYIDTVSAYGRYIYLVPDLGEPIYDFTLEGYRPDPEIRKKTESDINDLVKELGIDRSLYKIVNTGI